VPQQGQRYADVVLAQKMLPDEMPKILGQFFNRVHSS
jgi:hypothetical protein